MMWKILLTTLFLAVCVDQSFQKIKTKYHIAKTDEDFVGLVWDYAREGYAPVIITDKETPEVQQIKEFFKNVVYNVIVLDVSNERECLCAKQYLQTKGEYPYTVIINNNNLHKTKVTGYDKDCLLSMHNAAINKAQTLSHNTTVTRDMIDLIKKADYDKYTRYIRIKQLGNKEWINQLSQTYLTEADKTRFSSMFVLKPQQANSSSQQYRGNKKSSDWKRLSNHIGSSSQQAGSSSQQAGSSSQRFGSGFEDTLPQPWKKPRY